MCKKKFVIFFSSTTIFALRQTSHKKFNLPAKFKYFVCIKNFWIHKSCIICSFLKNAQKDYFSKKPWAMHDQLKFHIRKLASLKMFAQI